mgnify:CR=1 FL=1
MPPIINSDQTKISLETRNVFIEVTGTDLYRCQTSLAILAAQFSQYCDVDSKFTIEQVKVTYEDDATKSGMTPEMKYLDFDVEIDHINRLLGIQIDKQKVAECAIKMGLRVLDESTEQRVKVRVNPTRSDILHACDVVEDIGIGYGFNNI